MKILVMGAGKMGSFFIDLLSFEHEVAVFERDPKRMRFTYNCQRFTSYEEIEEFKPELLINAVTLKYTIPVFEQVIPHLPKECIISDIASVKTDLKEFYEASGMRYVSTHPMFGPTFANLQQLSEENAIIISEGDYMGRIFFKEFLQFSTDLRHLIVSIGIEENFLQQIVVLIQYTLGDSHVTLEGGTRCILMLHNSSKHKSADKWYRQ